MPTDQYHEPPDELSEGDIVELAEQAEDAVEE
jgi:hypothetical protein